jgi:ubiquitin C-terminal hydrolase
MSVNTQTSDIIFGLVNVKNSCYLNAAMQALLSVGSLSRFIKSNSTGESYEAISTFLESCRQGGEDGSYSFEPSSILDLNLFQEEKPGEAQHDVAEFLQLILNLIDVVPAFEVDITNICKICRSHTYHAICDEIIGLTFSGKDNETFNTLMDNFMIVDQIDGLSDCSNCNRATTKEQYRHFLTTENEHPPDVVQLSLKRWKQTRNGSIYKIKTKIDFPLELNFEVNFIDVCYCLKAFIYHTGMK